MLKVIKVLISYFVLILDMGGGGQPKKFKGIPSKNKKL